MHNSRAFPATFIKIHLQLKYGLKSRPMTAHQSANLLCIQFFAVIQSIRNFKQMRRQLGIMFMRLAK